MLPTLEEARKLVNGLFVELVAQITTEDAKKIRELVRNAAIRDDRKLSPRELEQVASAAEQIRAALAPLRVEQDSATGSKKGGVSKHINRVLDTLVKGADAHPEDAEFIAAVDAKNLDKARDLGAGLLADVLAAAGDDSTSASWRTTSACARTARSRRKTSTS